MIKKGEGISQTHNERNVGVMRSWFQTWVYQTAWNLRTIVDEFASGSPKISALKDYQPNFTNKDWPKGRIKRGPAIILGAGPSLDKNIELLKKSKMPVMLSETLVGLCKHEGIRTDYIYNYDAGHHWEAFLEGYDVADDTLVTHPGVDTDVIENWPGKKIYYLMNHISQVEPDSMKDGMTLEEIVQIIKKQIFGSELFEAVNPTLYPMISTTILNAGCVVNNILQVANFMGFGPFFLVGVDFGFPGDQNRARTWSHNSTDDTWESQEPKFGMTDEIAGRVLHIANNGVQTTEEQMEYKLALMAVYRIEQAQIYDCSEGIITELPKENLAEVIENNGKGFRKRSVEKIERICAEYFAEWNKVSNERNVDRKSKESGTVVDEGIGQREQSPITVGD